MQSLDINDAYLNDEDDEVDDIDNYDDDNRDDKHDDTCQRDLVLVQQEEQLSLWLQVVWNQVVWNQVVWSWVQVVWSWVQVVWSWVQVGGYLQGAPLLQVVCNVIFVNIKILACHHFFILHFHLNVETIGFLFTGAGGDL